MHSPIYFITQETDEEDIKELKENLPADYDILEYIPEADYVSAENDFKNDTLLEKLKEYDVKTNNIDEFMISEKTEYKWWEKSYENYMKLNSQIHDTKSYKENRRKIENLLYNKFGNIKIYNLDDGSFHDLDYILQEANYYMYKEYKIVAVYDYHY